MYHSDLAYVATKLGDFLVIFQPMAEYWVLMENEMMNIFLG
jgi:hypothetical protein